jgi:ABC-2 type transport system permease protein
MAGLAAPISARQQFQAIAWLRWRLFVNGFRRKGGAGELIARIIAYPFFALFVIGPAFGAAAASWFAIRDHHPDLLPGLFTGLFALQIVVSINLQPAGLSFDPESLIRFPVTLTRYVTVRLFLGLLSPSTIIGSFSLLGAAIGVTLARPALWPIAFAATLLLAVANMLFVRMVFAWVDRWLSTRRAREVFTGLIILVSIGIQYLNVTYNPGFAGRHGRAEQAKKLHDAMHFFHSAQGFLVHLPPGLAARSILQAAQGAVPLALADLLGVLLFALICLAVFTWRMAREYRGEILSDSGASPAAVAAVPSHPELPASAPALAEPSAQPRAGLTISPVVAALFEKEWIYVRRNTAQFYGMLAPLAMVFIFAGRMGSQFSRSEWTFPGAIAYSTLGIAILAYNALGLDAEGVQFYFLAPIRFRSVMLAKNLFGFAITFLQAGIVYGVLCFTTRRPDLLITLATLCWLVFAVLVNVTVGNLRSIIAPRKQDPSKVSRRNVSQLSALIALLLIAALVALGAGILLLGKFTGIAWLPIAILLALAAGAGVLYVSALNRLDGVIQTHRETMIEELCKVSS